MYDKHTAKSELDRIIARAGTAKALAEILGVSPQRLSDVRMKIDAGKKIPPAWAIQLEKIYGIDKSVFRPEYWPPNANEAERE